MSVKTVIIDINKVPEDGDDEEEEEGEVKHDGNNNYHYIDEDHSNERVNILLDTKPPDTPGYVTLKYTPHSGGTKISGIKESGISKDEFNASIKGCTSVTVYYWSGDEDFGNSLAVKLSGIQDSYYTTNSGDGWTTLKQGVNSLLKRLDHWSCSLNYAHIIDISKKDGQPYSCPSCSGQEAITLHSDVKNKYTKVTHEPDRFVCRLKNSRDNITSIPITKEISEVYVYWYTGEEPRRPLLICLKPKPKEEDEEDEGGEENTPLWYQRDNTGPNNWTKYDGGEQLDSDGEDEISGFLQKIHEEIKDTVSKHGSQEEDIQNDKDEAEDEDDEEEEEEGTTGPSVRDIVTYVAESLTGGGVGTEAVNFFFNPNKSATRQIIRLLTTRF